MKAIFVTYNQVHTDKVMRILDQNHARGFTKWAVTQGRGSQSGEPHYGTHAWPSMNSSVLAVVEDHLVDPILDALRELDDGSPEQGLRAFVWSVERGL